MKRAICAIAVLASMAMMFLLWNRLERQAETSAGAPENTSDKHVSSFAWDKMSDEKTEGTERAKEASPKVYKPNSFQTDSGGVVVEIDHGLPKQLVDTKEMRDGVNHGLEGAITLRVVDSTGSLVTGATVKGAFWNPGVKDRSFKVVTDEKGEASLKNKCTGDLNFMIDKEGYYRTSLRYWFFKNGYNCVKDGRWLPWNPLVEVTLKEKRNPIKMLVKNVDIKLPLKNTDYGFDFLIGDLVAPDGTGKIADIRMKCWGDKPYPPSRNYSNELLFVSASIDGGFIRKSNDAWSEFPSEYEAPKNEYSKEFYLSTKRSETKIFEHIELAATEYLIIKIVRGGNGENGTGVRYGEIYGPLIYGIMTNDREGAGVKFSYYLNPTVDDRNLEAEGRYP